MDWRIFNAFSEEINHSTVNFTYANADMLKSQSMPYSGKLPTAEDEIVLQESFWTAWDTQRN